MVVGGGRTNGCGKGKYAYILRPTVYTAYTALWKHATAQALGESLIPHQNWSFTIANTRIVCFGEHCWRRLISSWAQARKRAPPFNPLTVVQRYLYFRTRNDVCTSSQGRRSPHFLSFRESQTPIHSENGGVIVSYRIV